MGEASTFAGTCHCGAIRGTLAATKPAAELQVRACQCSFCTRHGAMTVSDPAGRATFEIDRCGVGEISVRHAHGHEPDLRPVRDVRRRDPGGRRARSGRCSTCAAWPSRSSRVAWRSPWCTRARRRRRASRGARPSGRRRRSCGGGGQTPRANVRDQQIRRGEGSDPLWHHMPTEILMPALSPTMEEGKLAKWLVKEGQTIKAGDVIAEIETDKATMEVEASDEGKLGKILVAEGTEGVKVNTPIATLLAEGESEGAAVASKAPSAKPAPAKAPSPQPPDLVRGKLSPQRGEGARAAPSAASRAAAASPGVAMQQVRQSSVAKPPVAGPSPRMAADKSSGRQRPWPHLRLAAGAQARAGAGRRRRRAQGLGSARAHHPARRGVALERRRRAAAGQARHRRSRPCRRRGTGRSPRPCRTTRSWRSTRRAPTTSSRTTACARSSPSA